MNRIRLFLHFATLAVFACLLPGCGGDSATTNTTNSTSSKSESNSAPAPKENVTSAGSASSRNSMADTPRRQDERWTDANGVEYLGNVPLDVFYDQPLTVAGDQTLLAGSSGTGPMLGGPGAAPSPTDSNMTPAEPPADPAPEAPSSGMAWEDLISAEEIKTEVTDSRNFLNKSLQRYGDYKKAMLMIPGKAASIAALAHIAMEHPESVSWKDDAIYIRDLAKKMNEETLKPDKKSHERVLTLFENITSTLDRSRPADLEVPSEDDSFVDVAGMDMLMVRLDEAEKRLKTEAGSEAAFDSKKEMIKHEASLLATLSHVITLEGYGYADDDEFKGYANNIVTAARKIRDSIDTNDFNSYELALSKVSTSCSDCHSAYRNN